MKSYAYGSDGHPDDPIEEIHPDYATSHELGKPSPGCGCFGCEMLRDGQNDVDELYQQCAESGHQLQSCSQCYPAVDPPDIDLDDTGLPW